MHQHLVTRRQVLKELEAFVPEHLADASVIDENWVLPATVAWVLGLLSGTLATGKAYYSQLAFRKAQDYRLADDRERESGNDSEAADAKSNADKHHTKGMSHRRHAEVSAGASIMFFFGVALAYMAISESFRLFVSSLFWCHPYSCPSWAPLTLAHFFS